MKYVLKYCNSGVRRPLHDHRITSTNTLKWSWSIGLKQRLPSSSLDMSGKQQPDPDLSEIYESNLQFPSLLTVLASVTLQIS